MLPEVVVIQLPCQGGKHLHVGIRRLPNRVDASRTTMRTGSPWIESQSIGSFSLKMQIELAVTASVLQCGIAKP